MVFFEGGSISETWTGLFCFEKAPCYIYKGIGILCLLQPQTDSLVIQLKAEEKDALLILAFLKRTYCMMQRSNNDTKIRNLHTELHNNNGKEGNNEDKPTHLNFLINWFNCKIFRTGHSFGMRKCFNETAFSEVLQWLFLWHLSFTPSSFLYH